MTFLGLYQLSCGPIPMKIGGNFPGGLPELPIRSKNKEFSRKTTIIRFNMFKQIYFFSPIIFLTANFFILLTTVPEHFRKHGYVTGHGQTTANYGRRTNYFTSKHN